MQRFFKSKVPFKNYGRLTGRHRVVLEELTDIPKKSLDIGCKTTKLGDVSIDVDLSVRPSVASDVRNLPFKNETFERVFFLEVIEHLPKNTENVALKEISRVLKTNGELILTTPNYYWVYNITDPAFILQGHRHHKKDELLKLVKNAGFEIEECFIRGGLRCLIFMTWYYLLTYTLGIRVPKIVIEKEDKDYNKERINGFTIFLKGRKQ